MNMIYLMFQQTMLFIIPLMIMALGDMFSERNGMVSTALEGIMTMGAFTGILFLSMTGGRVSGQMRLLLVILISTATGAVFTLLHTYASVNMRASQTTSGTALNMLAPAFTIFMARVIQEVQQIQFNNTLRIESAPLLGSTPFFGPLLFQNAYITTYLGVTILILSTLVLYRTRFGPRLRSCGEHPQVADAAGINVCRMQCTGILISGVLGGLGGLVFVVPTSTNFNADVAGHGFLALAVLTFGQWKPVKTMWTSLLSGLMRAVAAVYSDISFLAATRISSYVYKVISYVAVSIVPVFTSRNSRAPKASGIPYNKGQRQVGIYVIVW